MQTTLNLYRHLDQRREAFMGFSHIAALSGVLLLLVAVAYTVLFVMHNISKNEYAVLDKKLEEKKRLLQTEEQRLKLASEADIKQVINKRQTVLTKKRRLLGQISSGNTIESKGIAGHLDGLGRQIIEGIWLDRVELFDSGHAMSLGGYTRQAELLPRYLQALSNEAAFSGMIFDILQVENDIEKGDLLRFELAVLNDLAK